MVSLLDSAFFEYCIKSEILHLVLEMHYLYFLLPLVTLSV